MGDALTRNCAWCRSTLEVTARGDQLFCGQRCRQTAHRLRRRRATDEANTHSLAFAYADPPYPGLARKYYQDQPTYAGEVDHRDLIASLGAGNYAGWALSTSAKALRDVLPLCPEGARVCPWVKPIGTSSRTFGAHNTWEPLIVVGGRKLRGGFPDWLRAQSARGGGDLPGRKPLSFCAFLFQQLGMLPGDTLADLFPGSGVVGRAWAEMSRSSPGDASRAALGDGRTESSARAPRDASSRAAQNESLQPGRDGPLPRGPDDAAQEYSDDGWREVAHG